MFSGGMETIPCRRRGGASKIHYNEAMITWKILPFARFLRSALHALPLNRQNWLRNLCVCVARKLSLWKPAAPWLHSI
jgi:hypothetical protein